MDRIEEVAEVEKILDEELDTENGVLLARQLANIEKWSNRVSFLLYSAQKELDEVKRQALPGKSSQYTDVDRKIMLEAIVAPYQAKADYLEAMQENIRRRISFGQTLLKNVRVEIESGLA